MKTFIVVMKRKAWIEGQAVDAESGQPVHLERVVKCYFERTPDGEIVRGGCTSSQFEQPETGRFRVAYSSPDEYHLTLFATGYLAAEVFTPKVTELKTIDGLVVKLTSDKAGRTSEVPRQTISGIVTRNDVPIRTGWVGLWAMPRPRDSVNACLMRGRTAEPDPIVYTSALVQNGAYSIDVPFQDKYWYLVAEEPGHAPTQLEPVQVELNQQRKVDITCKTGGAIRGKLVSIPQTWQGYTWVVAFTKSGMRAETRAAADGTFLLERLAPGNMA